MKLSGAWEQQLAVGCFGGLGSPNTASWQPGCYFECGAFVLLVSWPEYYDQFSWQPDGLHQRSDFMFIFNSLSF